MPKSKIGKVRTFLKEFFGKLPVSRDMVHVGIVSFSRSASVVSAFESCASEPVALLNSRLDKIKDKVYSGGANVDLALKRANEALFKGSNGDRARVPNVLIVFVDGNGKGLAYPYEQTILALKVKY